MSCDIACHLSTHYFVKVGYELLAFCIILYTSKQRHRDHHRTDFTVLHYQLCVTVRPTPPKENRSDQVGEGAIDGRPQRLDILVEINRRHSALCNAFWGEFEFLEIQVRR